MNESFYKSLFQQLIVSTNTCLNKSLFRHEEHFVEEISPWKNVTWEVGNMLAEKRIPSPYGKVSSVFKLAFGMQSGATELHEL